MDGLTCTKGHIFYETTKIALRNLGIKQTNRDESVLIWYDAIKDQIPFSRFREWQVVNRIPSINLICHKAPFVRCIQRMSTYFPDLFDFLPQSYILPVDRGNFEKKWKHSTQKYVIKPSAGALGAGIIILQPGEICETVPIGQSVAQEYIESSLLRGYKFDFRIYCLLIPGDKPEIYVYRDGIARICSNPASCNDRFSQLTNTAVNIKNSGVDVHSITKLVSKVLGEVASGREEEVWASIERAICLTILSAYGIVKKDIQSKIRGYGMNYHRCFQILGFDVLLDQKLKPWILEVNYRPSLEFGTEQEKNLKVDLLKDVLRIAVPYGEIEQAVRAGKPWALESLLERARQFQHESLRNSKFHQVFPTDDPSKQKWYDVLSKSYVLSTDLDYRGLPKIERIQSCKQFVPTVPRPHVTPKVVTINLPKLHVPH